MSALFYFLSFIHISYLRFLESDATEKTKSGVYQAEKSRKKIETDSNSVIIKPAAEMSRLRENVTCSKKVENGK